jgi:hypothetical protein
MKYCGTYTIAPEKLEVIYNGVDLEEFNPAKREGGAPHDARKTGDI